MFLGQCGCLSGLAGCQIIISTGRREPVLNVISSIQHLLAANTVKWFDAVAASMGYPGFDSAISPKWPYIISDGRVNCVMK